MPRAMPVSCSAASGRPAASEACSIWKLTKRSARATTLSRAGPVSCSSASRMRRGFSASSPDVSVPIGAPIQRSMPSEPSAMSPLARRREALGARLELGGQRLLRGGAHRLAVLAVGALVGGEAEPLQLADMVAFDEHRAGRADFGFKHRVFSQAPHEHGCPAVYEAFRQPLMQRIRQSVFDLARFFLPVCRIGQPAGPVRDEGPGPDLRDAVRQRVDVALGGVGAAHLFGHVGLVDMAALGEVDDRSRRSGRHAGPARSGGSRAARRLPTAAPTRSRPVGEIADLRIARQMLERLRVDGRQGPRQPLDRRGRLDRALQRVEAGEVEAGGAPLQHLHRIEIMRPRSARPVRRRADRPGR